MQRRTSPDCTWDCTPFASTGRLQEHQTTGLAFCATRKRTCVGCEGSVLPLRVAHLGDDLDHAVGGVVVGVQHVHPRAARRVDLQQERNVHALGRSCANASRICTQGTLITTWKLHPTVTHSSHGQSHGRWGGGGVDKSSRPWVENTGRLPHHEPWSRLICLDFKSFFPVYLYKRCLCWQTCANFFLPLPRS